MYGRTNVFNREVTSNPIANHGANNYQSNNTSSTGNHHANEKLGSYRVEYKYEQPSPLLMSMYPLWKQGPPSSIMTKQTTFHMTITELRIEDYYMMRNKQLRSSHEQKLKICIRQQSFNEQLLRCNSHKLPPISYQRSPDIDSIRSGHYNIASNTNQNSSTNNIFTNNNQHGNHSAVGNNPSFGGTSFNGQANNATAKNIFATNSASLNNVFVKNSNGTSNNTVTGLNNSNSNNNFVSNNRNGNNNSNLNMLTSNNNSNTGNNSSINIFSNSNNGASHNGFNNSNGASNINFLNTTNRGGSNQQNNNSSNSNNIPPAGSLFANSNHGNNPSNNMLNSSSNNQNNNLSNNLTNNSLFAQNNNGNNHLNNGNNNMNPNFQPQTLFPNNNSQPQTLFPDNYCFQNNLQGFLYQNRQFLQMLLGKKMGEDYQGNNNKTQETTNKNVTLFDQRFLEDDFMQIDSGITNRRKSPQTVIYVTRRQDPSTNNSRKWNTGRNYIKLGQSQIKSNIFEDSRIENPQGQTINNFSSYNQGSKISKSKILFNQSKIINNSQFGGGDRQRETYNRNQTMNRQTTSRQQNHESDELKQLVWEYQCELQLRLKIVWLDDRYSQITQQDRCMIETSLFLPYGISTNTRQSRLEIVKILKQKYAFIRCDAQIFINSFSRVSSTFSVQGKLEQRIINLSGREGDEDYKIYFSKIKNNQLFNLTISNIYGTVSWDKPILLDQLDFNKDNMETFCIDNNSITCEVASLNLPCRVTFNTLPDKYKKIYKVNPEEAKQKFQEQLKKMSKNFQLSEIWNHGDSYVWSMAVSKFDQDENLEQ